MPLKPDDMAAAMLTALPQAWKEVKGVDFPGGGQDDQRVLFIAIARGLLTYLESNQNTIINTIRLKDPVSGSSFTYNVDALDLNTDLR